MVIEEVRKESIADQVARQLRRLILNDHVQAGSRLPPERDLAVRFGTNRNTLREAVRMLEEEGLVSVRHGGGMEVLDYRKAGGIQLLPHYLRDVDDPARRAEVVLDAMYLRRVAMELVARIAAQNITEGGAAELARAMDGVREAVDADRDVASADLEFYEALGRATGSVVICWLINTMVDVTRSMITDARLWVTEEGYLAHVQAVCDAVMARDPGRAEAAVRARFDVVDAAVAARLASWENTSGGGN